ncbi:hypothetical protein HN51_031847, partial [Arachis hypogaea]
QHSRPTHRSSATTVRKPSTPGRTAPRTPRRVQASGSIREGQANAAGQGSKEATKDTRGTGRS